MSPPAREEVTLGELVGVAQRRAPWLLGGLALGACAAVAWLRLVPLEFEARGLLLFQAETPSTELLASLDLTAGLGLLAGSSAAVAGEIEALRARPLLERVLRQQGPAAPPGRCVQVDDLARTSAWQALRGAPAELAGLAVEVEAWPFPDDEPEGLVLEFLSGARVAARREGWFGERAEPVAFHAGSPFTVLGATLVVRGEGAAFEGDSEGDFDGRRLRVRCPALARAADEFGEVLRVVEEPSGSSAVQVTVPDADARRALATANGLISAYLDENQARRRRLAGRPVEFLEGELARVHAELASAEARLQALGEERGPLALPGVATELVKKLSEVDLERAKLELELKAAEDLLERLRTGELSGDELAALEATGVFRHDLVEPLIGLVARRAELVREFTAAHPEVAQADAAIAQRVEALGSVLETERWKRSEATQGFDALVQQYQGELDLLPAIQVEVVRETRSVEAITQIYLFLVARIEEARIGQASSVPNVEVLAWAAPPYEPSSAEPWLVWAAGLALGLAAGVGAAFLREYQERPLVSARRVEALLGVECLSLGRGQGSEGVVRTLRALLPRGEEARRAVVLVPVGRRAREGELAAGLARACAQAGERVLLADADLDAGRLHERFQRAAAPGLGELAATDATETGSPKTTGALQATGEPGLTLVARGAGRRPTPAGLARCLETWRRDYDRVLVSAPPLARSASAYELASHEASCVLVLAGTNEEELVLVARRLAQCGARSAAAVIEA